MDGNGITIIEPKFIKRKGIFLPERYAVPKALDLFAGCGGFSLGFMQAGFEVVGAVEWEEYATLSYLTNLGSFPVNVHYIDGDEGKKRLNKAAEKCMPEREKLKKAMDKDKIERAIKNFHSGSGWIAQHPEALPVRNFWFGDIRKLKGETILKELGLEEGEIDCIMGGPPCQGFTTIGKRDPDDFRNSLVFEFCRMVIEINPKTFVMENVPGMLTMTTADGWNVIDAICMTLADGGYGTFEKLRRGMAATAGCGGAMRGKAAKKPDKEMKKKLNPKIKPAQKPQPIKQESSQMSLL